ncbi:hypothetical protein KY290_026083 [Solanum tuberosum]|uniref:Retrotransposon gag domain-containing protein n=1 Tax=Solanum tuberosum TaxID=4113 RepID=A0ABQ7UXD1_SOLTU|nr:hypothetical protein KY290_026083 [Solanum tuberosum]
MLSQAVTNQIVQQRGDRQEGANTSRIREFLRMNPPSFTGSSTIEDPENFIEELKKVFDVMHVADIERVELAAYQMKNVSRTWFDQWKGGRAEDAPPASWACFKEDFLGRFFPRELKEAKVQEFFTLKQDTLSVHEFGLKFTQLSHYAPEMVADMKSRMSLFVVGLSRLSSKEGRAAMLIDDMDISRLMVYVQQVEDEKLRDIEQFKSKRAKTGSESGQQMSNDNRSSFQQEQKGPAPSSASAHAPRNKGEYNGQNSIAKPAQPQDMVAQMSKWASACARCGRTHPGKCRQGQTGCFNCGQEGHFMRVSKEHARKKVLVEEQIAYMLSTIAKSKRIHQMLSLIAMNFDAIPEQISEPFSVSTPVGESILAERVYRDCPIFVNHKSTMTDLIELDMVDFDVILGMDWLHACYASVNCRTRVVRFQFPNEPVLEWKRSSTVPKGHFISYLKARKMAPAELKKLKEQLKMHEKNYPTHDLELVAVIFALTYDAIIFMVFMWKCSPITRVFSMYMVRKSLISDRESG